MRRRPPVTWVGAVLLLLLAGVRPSPLAAQSGYTLDTDPLRLGRQAWESLDFARAEAEYQRALDDEYKMADAEFGLGQVAEAAGRLTEAVDHFRNAVNLQLAEKGEAYPAARAEASVVLYDLEQMEASAREARLALGESPKLWAAVYAGALQAIREDRIQEAAKMITPGSRLKGWIEGEDRYHHAAALIALDQGALDTAEGHAAQAAAINPRRFAYPLLMVRIYNEKKIPALALNAWEQTRAIAGFTPTAAQLTQLGEVYESLHRYNEARDNYLAAIAADSTFAPVTLKLADLFRRGGQAENAARAYQRYLQLEPGDVDALLILSDLAGETGRAQAAADAALQAYAVDSVRVDVLQAVVRTGFRSGDAATRDEALRVYSEAAPATFTPEEHLSAATFFAAEGRLGDAEQSLGEAIRLDPDDADLRFRAGMVELKASRPESAAVRFSEAAALDSTRVPFFFNLGVAMVRSQNPEGALAPLLHAMELDPGFLEGRLLLARVLMQLDSPRKAYDQYEMALGIDPSLGPAHMEAGYCAVLMGNFRDAERHYRSATEANPSDANAWAALGNAYLGLQDWNRAEEALGRARAIDPGNTAMLRGFELLQQARSGG